MSLTSEEKRKFLKALEEDAEFRYAIAGLVGYKEILARLAEHDRKFEEIMARLEEHDRKFEEIIGEIRGIKERMLEHDRKFEEIMEEIRTTRRTMERFALTLEDEAREVTQWIFRNKGIQIELTSVELAGVQYDIYGEADDLIVIGEVKTRLSGKAVEEFADKVDKLLKLRPEIRKRNLIRVMYAMIVLPEAVNEAKAREISLITAKGLVVDFLQAYQGA
ncbi:MAG: hypothetical protein QXH90_07740 [Candidatus Korarchaeum sp.]